MKKALIFIFILFNASIKLFGQETLQTVTTRGNTTTATMTSNSGSITPVNTGNATGNFNLFAGSGGPSLSMGIVNTNNSTTHWGWLQTAYANSAQAFGYLVFNPMGGNVGIGTISPATTLYVQNAGVNYSSTLTLKNTSNSPTSRAGFTLENDAGNQTYFYKQASGNTDANDVILYSGQGDTRIYTAGSEQMRITNSGTVGIGTTNTQGYKFAVNGSIHAKQVNIDMVGWSDYVFKPAYHLPSLSEVKAYVDLNHHLPEIPSEKEIATNGLNLGDIDRLLTQKVEELTLYLIDKDKQLNEEKETILTQQNQIDTQKKQLEQVNMQLKTQEDRLKAIELELTKKSK